MTHTGRYYGAIEFCGDPDQALDHFTRIATATLEDYGHPVERQSILNRSHARIVASHYLIRLTMAPAPPAMNEVRANSSPRLRLVIDLSPVNPGHDDKDISELILVVMLFRMVDIYLTSKIEWLDSETVLTLEQFLAAFSNVSPRRVRGRQEVVNHGANPFHSVDETEAQLASRFDTLTGTAAHSGRFGLIDLSAEETLSFAYRYCPRPDEIEAPAREQEAASDIQRLATWGMTGMIGFLSAPVALSMAAVNLARGEDFRLNTNVLSLTGLLVMLQSTGALASAVSYLPL